MKITTQDKISIEAQRGDAYLNVVCGPAHLEAWTHESKPAYVVKRGYDLTLVTFAGIEWADEWFREHTDYEVLWSNVDLH